MAREHASKGLRNLENFKFFKIPNFQGVVSLANTTIGSIELEHHCGITISAKGDDDNRSTDVVLVCETELQRHKWIDALKRASQM